MRVMNWISAAAGTVALSACAAGLPPVEVTRFHAPQLSQARGTIAIEPLVGPDAASLEFRTYAAAVRTAAQAAGFTVQDSGSDMVAYVAQQSTIRPRAVPGRTSPVSVGVGGSTGSYGSGLGLGIGINLSGRPKDVVLHEMQVQIRRRGEPDNIWEGRAVTQAREGTPAAQRGIAAGKLANALFKDFPGRSGETISVP